MNDVSAIVWQVLNSPAVVAAIAGIALWGLNRIYARRPEWRKFEGSIIAAVKWAEKQIPDDTPNRALNRLNAALGYVLQVYESATGRKPTSDVMRELREAIQIVHARLEADGNLRGEKAEENQGCGSSQN